MDDIGDIFTDKRLKTKKAADSTRVIQLSGVKREPKRYPEQASERTVQSELLRPKQAKASRPNYAIRQQQSSPDANQTDVSQMGLIKSHQQSPKNYASDCKNLKRLVFFTNNSLKQAKKEAIKDAKIQALKEISSEPLRQSEKQAQLKPKKSSTETRQGLPKHNKNASFKQRLERAERKEYKETLESYREQVKERKLFKTVSSTSTVGNTGDLIKPKNSGLDFIQMTPYMRKRRIKYLWNKVRHAFKVKSLISEFQHEILERKIDNFGLDSDVDFFLPENQQLEEELVEAEDNAFSDLAWYLINPESNFSMFQNIQVQLVTWTTCILTPILYVFGTEYPEIKKSLLPLEWLCDISWTAEICLNFITASSHERTFKQISTNYLKSWFLVDALATFPTIISLQNSRLAYQLKMLRLLHLFDIFNPFWLLLRNVLMRKQMNYEVENSYKLVILFTATLLSAHLLALGWIEIGLKHEDGWIKKLQEKDYDGVWASYGPKEMYIFSLYGQIISLINCFLI